MSENDDDIDGIDEDEDERPELDGLEVVAAYGLPSANNPNDTFEFVSLGGTLMLGVQETRV